MTIDEYLKLQEQEFHEFGRNIEKLILVAADSFDTLKNFYEPMGATVNPYKDNESYIVEKNNGECHLFIKGSNLQYRKRFIDFLNVKYNVPKDTVPSSLNVDHVFNKERAKDYFIRMILLDEKSNQAWGRAYEKSMTRIDKYKDSAKKAMILLDYSVFLKILELPSFKKGNIKGKDDIQRIANEARQELEKLFGADIIPLDVVETFYRAEVNQLKYGYWNVPFYIKAKHFNLTVLKQPYKGRFQFIMQEIKSIFESVLKNQFVVDFKESLSELDTHKYLIISSLAINRGNVIVKEIGDVSNHLLSNIDEAIELDWEIKVRNKLVQTMIIRVYKEGYNDIDTIRYEFQLDSPS
ncbi:hypothetical protein [Metabacillus malikii]|uniref:Restriction endonuclease n=1 Tax=Metabacillus malikii TaxID=1504265 RepID=A0ABT9ZPD0_9BACI|nr:hypothetical protein [Metabacillus malikii]MDQ0233090.1 hypothetical protein [Metabacillus malikii]